MKIQFKRAAAAILAGILAAQGFCQSRKVDIWDFGGKAESGAGVRNNISVKDIDGLPQLAAGKYTAGDITFGDLTINAVANDRAYYSGSKNYGTQGYASFVFDDGYESDGIYYCNGTGGEGRRYLLVRNVQAGDTITFYARLSNSAQEKINFVHVNASLERTGLQSEKADLEGDSRKYEYVATQSGAYKIYADTNGGKPVYYRVVRTPGANFSGRLENLSSGAKANLKFVSAESGKELEASISGSNYSVNLAEGQWTAILSGIKGYGIATSSKILKVTSSDIQQGKVSRNLAVAEQKSYKLEGRISGFEAGTDASKFSLVFVPSNQTLYQKVKAPLGKDLSFSAELEPAVKYTAILEGANDYMVKSGAEVNNMANAQVAMAVAKKPVYSVTGAFFSNDGSFAKSDIPSSVNFVNAADGYSYAGKISGGKFSVSLRDGLYEVRAESEKFKATNHVRVEGKNMTRDIKMSAKDKKIQPVARKKSISVGAKKEYKTLGAAVRAAAGMNPASEKERIEIVIEPGVYREQVIITTPYITLKNADPKKEVKLTWYYGIGYKYYSAGKDGFYDDDRAYDKIEKLGAARWGVATYVKPSAKGFKAENITFETSFNKYITDEEIADGVESDGSIAFARKLNSDVRSKASTERSAAICTEADESEFYNCRFLGSQDTLYTGKDTKQYFKNCFVEGNTDFIFGDGDVVFENCQIHFAGYTDREQGGYLTAARQEGGKGYLFYNCLVSQDTSVFYETGFLGRPWGKNARVAFVNTVLGNEDIIDFDGWTSMSGNSPAKANFREFNTLWNGKRTDLADLRVKGTVLPSESGYTPKDFLGSWKPAYFDNSYSGAVKFSKKPSFTTDDDINTPYPGHTLSLHYSLGKADPDDASQIFWYRLKDGKEKLVKQSTGFGEKTYTLTKEDTGCQIKAVVKSALRGGITGPEAEIVLEEKVKDGVSVPAKATGGARIANKVNVFLAGDSTVKDYSAKGMYQGGKIRDEGAWGEFLADYLNDSVAVQNYANGGRSTRNFINEGTLDKIAANIGKGDFLFIQFGHNDSSDGQGYLEDRYVPVGKPNGKGVYPASEGKKVATPASYASRYGDKFYAYDSGGTFKWYLKQYIDVAKKAGATPVLVTPVSRMYFGEGGKIRVHHNDSTDATKDTYVEAVRQLAKEEGVLLIDGFELSKSLYEAAYKDAGGTDSFARELMFSGDSTHNNKLGGFILAGLFARQIKAQIPALAKSVVAPAKAIGENYDGSMMFTVDTKGAFSCGSEYWTKYAEGMFKKLK